MIIHAGYKGSASSGNYAHEGRPGKEGGSLPKAGGAAVGGGAAPTSNQASNTSIPLPRLTIPLGEVPPSEEGDPDGKKSYQAWYASMKTKPNLADALAMRKYFSDRALAAGQVKGQADAEKKAAARAKRLEEERNAPKVLTPKEKKAQEAANKKAATAAASAKKKADAAIIAAKKKADAAALKKQKADEVAAKKAGAAKAPGAGKAGAVPKVDPKIAKEAEKTAAQAKVAEAIGMSAEGFNTFKDTIAQIRAGDKPDAGVVAALVGAGLLAKSGDSVTVPPAALTLLSAILASDAIKAQAALDKLKGTKEIGQVRMRKITKYVIDSKGSSTSGNHGHAGIPGKRGGSAPKGSGVVSAATAPVPAPAAPPADPRIEQARKFIQPGKIATPDVVDAVAKYAATKLYVDRLKSISVSKVLGGDLNSATGMGLHRAIFTDQGREIRINVKYTDGTTFTSRFYPDARSK